MGTVSEKLTYLNETKTAIKDAITAKGVEVSDTDTFRSYATKIEEISGGVPPVGGEIQVINKTGAVVNEGDKLWVNENSYVGGSTKNITGYSGALGRYGGYIDTTGNFAYMYNKTYTVSSDDSGQLQTTNVGSFTNSNLWLVYYGADNGIYNQENSSATLKRCDSFAQWSVTGNIIPTSEKNKLYKIYSDKFQELDPKTGLVVKEWTGSVSTSSVKIGEYIYDLNSAARYKLNEDGTLTFADYTINTKSSKLVFGITEDGKYLLRASGNFSGYGYLSIYEVVDENTIKRLSVSEFPEELQPYYSSTTAYYMFNPTNGILTCAHYETADYLIMQYKDGEWKKLVIDLNIPDKTPMAAITLSNDLTVGAYCYYNSKGYLQLTALQNIKQHAALPYKPYNINETTITSTAKTSANPGETLTATIGGNLTEVYNQDKTVTENGTYTADEGFTGLGTVTVNIPETTKWGATVTDLLGDVDENGNIVCSGKIDLVIPENATTIPVSGIGLTKSLRSIDFSNVSVINANGLRRMFNYSNLETVDMSNVIQIKASGMLCCFEYSSNLKSIRFDKLEAIYAQGLAYAFSTCSSLTSIEFPKLVWISTAGFGIAFRGTQITTLSFPSLVTFYTKDALVDMGKDCTTLTEIHFRADVQSKVEALTGYSSKFGAPSTCTIYFDL